MTKEPKGLLKEWCDACGREYGEECWACLLWGFLLAVEMHYKKGTTMTEAMKYYMRLSPPPKEARKTLEEAIGTPLDVAQMLLREIKDYENCPDV